MEDDLTIHLRRAASRSAAIAAALGPLLTVGILTAGVSLAQSPSPDPAPVAPAQAPPTPVQPAPQPPAAPPAPPMPPRAGGTPALVVDTQDFESIMGKNVRSAADEEMGRVVDVIVGAQGEARAAVIDFGGFLGVGSRKVAVDWKAIQFATGGKVGRITLALTRAQVRLSPEFKSGEPIVILGATMPGPEPVAVDPAKPKTDP